MPPRRDRTTPRPEDPPLLRALDDAADAAEAAESEDIDATHARLQGQLAERRKRREIQEMRRELEGLATDTALTGETPANRKRGVSSSTSTSEASKRLYIRPKTPPIYEGKNIRELQGYEAAWKVYLDAVAIRENRMLEDSESIALAATFLRGSALDAWGRCTETSRPQTWNGYLGWLRNLVADPANRVGIASLRLKHLVQGERQSVRDLVTYIEGLEQDIPALSTEELRAWTLLNCLRDDIRKEVIRENRTISSREQVITSAQRQEELLKGATPESNIGEKPARGVRSAPRSESKKDLMCYKCGKEGHFARECPKKEDARFASS